MSVFAKVKEIVAEMADGAHHALLHVAQEVDKLKEGTPAVDLDKLVASLDLTKLGAAVSAVVGPSIETKADAFFADLKAEFASRLADVEAMVSGLKEKIEASAAPKPDNSEAVAAATAAPAAAETNQAPAKVEGEASQAAPGSAA